ncbi:transposase [uncultured Bacteroides sp.]|uniref:transposase n=1 Tax=uncultured Bacteroides sp. TaxID=162156 RepID=UPI002AAB021A|nr:transposase [uncultured Bacteroides sp.]
MQKERKHYDSLFKRMRLNSYERKNVSGLAQELSVSAALLYHWRNEYKQYGKGIIKQTLEEKEFNEMKKRMRDIEMENEILIKH